MFVLLVVYHAEDWRKGNMKFLGIKWGEKDPNGKRERITQNSPPQRRRVNFDLKWVKMVFLRNLVV
jgi:hypothetical protein